MTPQEALIKTKIALMNNNDSVFFTTLALSFQYEWDTRVPRAMTNGVKVWLNPDSWMELSPRQRLSRLMHETLHPVFEHIEMMATKMFDHDLLNQAGDYYINNLLISKGYERIKTWLVDDRFIGMTTMQIYRILEKEEKNNPGTHKMPEEEKDVDSKLPPNMDQQQYKRHIDDILIRAHIQAKMENENLDGLPDSLRIYIDQLLNPKLPWHVIFRKYLQRFHQGDYSFAKPNRRFFPKHYMPSLHSTCVNDFHVYFDGSASVSDNEFAHMVSHTYNGIKAVRPKKITLSVFDDVIKSTEIVRSRSQLMRMEFKARGGTQIRPVFEHIAKDKPEVALIFSDGEFFFPPDLEKPKTDIIWLIYNDPDFTAPFGKIIHYEV